jgi:hypothetical protein
MKLFSKSGALGLLGLLASSLPVWAQETTDQTTPASPDAGVSFHLSGFPALIFFAFWLLMIVSAWKVFTKAGKPGWAIFVPIYNFVVFFQICGRSPWWVLFPIILFVTPFDLAKRFGKGAGFGWGLFFLSPIFYPLLAFSDAKYTGPATAGAPVSA